MKYKLDLKQFAKKEISLVKYLLNEVDLAVVNTVAKEDNECHRDLKTIRGELLLKLEIMFKNYEPILKDLVTRERGYLLQTLKVMTECLQQLDKAFNSTDEKYFGSNDVNENTEENKTTPQAKG